MNNVRDKYKTWINNVRDELYTIFMPCRQNMFRPEKWNENCGRVYPSRCVDRLTRQQKWNENCGSLYLSRCVDPLTHQDKWNENCGSLYLSRRVHPLTHLSTRAYTNPCLHLQMLKSCAFKFLEFWWVFMADPPIRQKWRMKLSLSD